ncbi:MAG: hypothetical protein JNL82_32160 [Myxococcales bacterium]|nr:hypothetical protein [Myxococcales bacterium]HRH37932.1 hypothetical protein [Flavobacteriales bacterium]
MTKSTIENKKTGETFEVVPAQTVSEALARGAILFGSACLAVGGAIGYAFGLLDGARRRKEGERHEV